MSRLGTLSRTSLRQTEAVERAAALTVRTVHLDLDLTEPDVDTFASTTTIAFASAASSSFVEFAGAELLSAELNGRPLDVATWREGRLPLAGLDADNTLVVRGRMGYSGDGEGLHRHIDPADGQRYLYAMSFLDAAPRWFACFDQPDLKARYTLTVTAPSEWTVWGNGPASRLAPGRWRLDPPQLLASYFVTLLAGPYVSVLDEHRGTRLGVHARASLGERLRAEAPDLLRVTKQSLDYFEEIFGYGYPFGDYHQGFVPDFNAGAMENPGCVLLRDSFLEHARSTFSDRGQRAAVIAHEMAHMWFGNLVTMRWWNDLWLNESFAEYAGHRCCGAATDYRLATEFGIVRKDWGMVADQSPSTHPVAMEAAADAASALAAFDGISYAKGAAVLQQLVAYLGDEVFLAGLQRYFRRHAYANAELADLLAAWTEAGAEGLSEWSAAWLRQAGLDTLAVTGSGASLSVTRSGPPGAPPRPEPTAPEAPGTDPARPDSVMPTRAHTVQLGAVAADGTVHRSPRVLVGSSPVPVPGGAEAALVVPDVGDDTWAKVRFGGDGWLRLTEVLPRISDGPVLVVAGNAIRDAVRDAELAPVMALTLITERLPDDVDDIVWASLFEFAQRELAGAYCPPAERPARLTRVLGAARARLAAAAPGSDTQLTAFRQVVASAAEPSELRDWADGRRVPAGLELDTELRWGCVERLCALVDARDDIGRALQSDPSTAGQVHAARARAALPSAEAKAQAWTLLTEPSDSRPHELYATGEAFFGPEQSELTKPYVERYFTEIPGTASFRSGWILASVATKAFPWSAPTTAALGWAEQALATELPTALRRPLVDGTDKLARARRSLDHFS